MNTGSPCTDAHKDFTKLTNVDLPHQWPLETAIRGGRTVAADAKSPRVLCDASLAAGEQLANDRHLASVLSRLRAAAGGERRDHNLAALSIVEREAG